MTNYIYPKEQLLKTIKEQELSNLEKAELEFLAADLHLQLEVAKDAIRFLSGTSRHQEIIIENLKSEFKNIVRGKTATGIIGTTYKIGKRNQMFESARKSIDAKLAQDPKQDDIKKVKDWWNKWQKNPSQYSSAAEFAREVIKKCEHLTSTKNIENLCSKWKKEL